MSRPVRRKDREITDPKLIEDIIRRSSVCRLAMCLDDQPYVVTLNFGYQDGRLYFHSAREGRKIETIRANPKVSFVFDLDHELTPADRACEWGFKYRSVIGFGRARVLTDPEAKRRGLKALMAHYGEQGYDFAEENVDRLAVIEVEIDELTGKQAGY